MVVRNAELRRVIPDGVYIRGELYVTIVDDNTNEKHRKRVAIYNRIPPIARITDPDFKGYYVRNKKPNTRKKN